MSKIQRLGKPVGSGLAAVVACLLLGGCQRPVATAPPAQSPEVYFSTPVAESVTEFEEFPGRTDAFKSVEVKARVTGYLDKVLFTDGSEVEKGALLFQIDPRSYQAEADRAKATLEQAEAHQNRLESDYKRFSALLSRGTATREEFDRAAGDLAEARAAIGVAKAQLDLAQLDLGFTKVSAAISGRISRRMVDPGNLVKADETLLTTIVSLDPVYVYFDIDERTLLRIRRLIREGKVKSRGEAEIPVLAALADEDDFDHKGTLDFSENRVDPNTGTLRVRGLISNPLQRTGANTRVLSPGMFLRVRLPIGDPHPALLIPEQAVGTDQGKKYLYVINRSTNKEGESVEAVEYRPVTVGKLDDRGFRVIEKGLNVGERVVVRGLQRVKQGMRVTPVQDKVIGLARTVGDPQPTKPLADQSPSAGSAPSTKQVDPTQAKLPPSPAKPTS